MKKLLLALSVTGLLKIGFAQQVEYPEGTKKTFYALNQGLTDCKIKMKNVKGTDITLKYQRIVADTVPTWEYTTCDNFNCMVGLPMQGTFFPMKNDELGEIKITIDPKGFSGTTVVQYELWDEDAPTVKDTLEHTIIVSWGAGTADIANTVSVFPNPAKDVLNINGINNAVFTITNQMGQTLASSTSKTLPIGNLANGVYYLQVQTANASFTKTFIKE